MGICILLPWNFKTGSATGSIFGQLIQIHPYLIYIFSCQWKQRKSARAKKSTSAKKAVTGRMGKGKEEENKKVSIRKLVLYIKCSLRCKIFLVKVSFIYRKVVSNVVAFFLENTEENFSSNLMNYLHFISLPCWDASFYVKVLFWFSLE